MASDYLEGNLALPDPRTEDLGGLMQNWTHLWWLGFLLCSPLGIVMLLMHRTKEDE